MEVSMLARIAAFTAVSLASFSTFSGTPEHRVTGSVWENQDQVARFDFTAVPGKPARITMGNGKELEVVVAPSGTRTMRILDGSGQQLHSAVMGPDAPTDRTFRYSFCGSGVAFASPEPAEMPRCPQG
jgi:hypothetical protein